MYLKLCTLLLFVLGSSFAIAPPRAAVEDLITSIPSLASLGWTYESYLDSCNVPLDGISCGLRPVTVNGTVQYVNYPLFLYFENVRLGGVLSSTVNQLELQTITLRNVSLGGSIPSSLFSSPFLLGLDLRYNLLTGVVPSQISSAVNIIEIKLANNSLTGTIPSSLYLLSNLSILNLENNRLEGPWPNRPSNGNKLSILSLRGNTGPFCINKEDTNVCLADSYSSCGCLASLCNPSSSCISNTSPVKSTASTTKMCLVWAILLQICLLFVNFSSL